MIKDNARLLRVQRRSACVLMLLLLVCTACVTGGRADGRGVRRDLRVLSLDEMRASGATTLYDAVERLRPNWLNVRAPARSLGLETGVVVYQGNNLLGDPGILRQYHLDGVLELRYLDGPTASSTLPGLGSRHVAGAIVIVVSTVQPHR